MKRWGVVVLLLAQIALNAQDSLRAKATAQWRAYRFGLFIHWGVATCRDLRSRTRMRERAP